MLLSRARPLALEKRAQEEKRRRKKRTGAPSSPGGERSRTRETNSCFPPLSEGSSTRPMSRTLMPACSRRLPGGGVTRIWMV